MPFSNPLSRGPFAKQGYRFCHLAAVEFSREFSTHGKKVATTVFRRVSDD
jgi:hypothetical protein